MKKIIALIFLTLQSFANANVIQLNAEYTVPTMIKEELGMNTFQLENYEVETLTDGNAFMRFKLPITMVGHNQHKFELKLIGISTDSTKILSSPTAKAVCQGPWVNMSCSIAFTQLIMDNKAVEQSLQEQFPVAEAAIRHKLLLKFNSDPIGTVKVVAK